MASVPRRKSESKMPEPALKELSMPTIVAIPKKGSETASTPSMLSSDEVYRLIQETAYFKAEARQFAPGVELQDWLDAEKEVKQRLQIS